MLAAGASEFEGLSPPAPGPLRTGRNRSFTPEVLLSQAADPRYERLHVATHAEFLPGGPSQAHIFTGTSAVSLQEFTRFRQQRSGSPLELSVLSACRTALSDSNSEVGFPGLALQAGSRSAIGTLWYVDDVATSAFFCSSITTSTRASGKTMPSGPHGRRWPLARCGCKAIRSSGPMALRFSRN